VCGWQVKLCDPLVTHGPYLSALEIRVGIIKRYGNGLFTLFTTTTMMMVMMMLCRFERALQRHCSTCCIPYIDTRLDCSLPRPSDSAIWTSPYFGNNQGPVRTGMAANWAAEPSDCDIYGNGRVMRYANTESCWSGLLYTQRMIDTVTRSESYDDLVQPYDFNDFENEHGGPHMFLGGHMEALPCAPLDPFFWSHHCWVDMLVQMLKDLLPASSWRYPNNWLVPFAQRAGDRMRPFQYRNADGMYDNIIGKNYMYEVSPADETCKTEADCRSPTGLLWCDTSRGAGQCKAKCRQGGSCGRGPNAMCHCMSGTPRCDAGICRCVRTNP